MTPSAIRTAALVAVALVVFELAAQIFSANNSLIRLVGGLTILLVPAAAAWRARRFRLLGVEGLLPLAFYLSMYHGPLVRLVMGGRDLDEVEWHVLHIALYCSAAVSLLVAFASRPISAPLSDIPRPAATRLAIVGLVVNVLGLGLFVTWVTSAGAETVFSADLGEIYLLQSTQTSVTFQTPFLMVGLVTTAIALARHPPPAPGWIRLAFYTLAALTIVLMARLGTRGPILELLLAIYLVRRGTRRPVTARAIAAALAAFSVGFYVVSAARTNLSDGFSTLSTERVIDSAQKSVDPTVDSEFDEIFANHSDMVRFAGTKVRFLEGQSYLDIPLQLVPRQIVGEKPVPLSMWWAQYIDPEGADRGSARAFGSFTEGYLNFGAVGAVCQVAAVTLLLLALYPRLRSRSPALGAATAVALAHAYHFHRSEFIHAAFTVRNAFIVGLLVMAIDAALQLADEGLRDRFVSVHRHPLRSGSARTNPVPGARGGKAPGDPKGRFASDTEADVTLGFTTATPPENSRT